MATKRPADRDDHPRADRVHVHMAALRGAGFRYVERAGVHVFRGISLDPVAAAALRPVANALGWRFLAEDVAASQLAMEIGEATAGLDAARAAAAADIAAAQRLLDDATGSTEPGQVAAYREVVAEMVERQAAAGQGRLISQAAKLLELDQAAHSLLAASQVRAALEKFEASRHGLDDDLDQLRRLAAALADVEQEAAAAAAGDRDALRQRLAAVSASRTDIAQLRQLAAELARQIEALAGQPGAAA